MDVSQKESFSFAKINIEKISIVQLKIDLTCYIIIYNFLGYI